MDVFCALVAAPPKKENKGVGGGGTLGGGRATFREHPRGQCVEDPRRGAERFKSSA